MHLDKTIMASYRFLHPTFKNKESSFDCLFVCCYDFLRRPRQSFGVIMNGFYGCVGVRVSPLDLGTKAILPDITIIIIIIVVGDDLVFFPFIIS